LEQVNSIPEHTKHHLIASTVVIVVVKHYHKP